MDFYSYFWYFFNCMYTETKDTDECNFVFVRTNQVNEIDLDSIFKIIYAEWEKNKIATDRLVSEGFEAAMKMQQWIFTASGVELAACCCGCTDKPPCPQGSSTQLCPQTEMTVNGCEEQQAADGHLEHPRRECTRCSCPSLSAFITACLMFTCDEQQRRGLRLQLTLKDKTPTVAEKWTNTAAYQLFCRPKKQRQST